MENFYQVLNHANLLYGLEMNEDDAVEIGLIAWNKIGNKQCRLYRYITNIDKDTLSVELPCNCDEVEAVTYGFEDWNYTTSDTVNGDYNSLFTEHYIEGRKEFKNAFYSSGRFVKYERVNDTLYFEENYGPIQILYKGVELDENELPYLTEKEVDAIACYLAFTQRFKEGWAAHNAQMIQEAQLLEQRWLKLCDAARVKYLNQNDMDKILDAKHKFNRKIFNKAYKPVR